MTTTDIPPADFADETAGLQPLLHDAVAVLRAPTQAWSNRAGDMEGGVHGLYHSDTRMLRRVRLRIDGRRPEHVSTADDSASQVTFASLLRGLGEPTPDPRLRIDRRRRVSAGRLLEEIAIASALDEAVELQLELELEADFSPIHVVKAGGAAASPRPVRVHGGASWQQGPLALTVTAADASPQVLPDGRLVLRRRLRVPARGSAVQRWEAVVRDDGAVVAASASRSPWLAADAPPSDPRLAAWLRRAASDLEALRMTRVGSPDVFLAAGAPWFFTLFGRDSLWAARFLLPVDPALALSTLRVLAELQGGASDPATGEQPGKIMHELRPTGVAIPDEGVVLPPLYYGTIDATPLWICLLHDAWRAGAARADIAALLPALRRALGWMKAAAEAGDGFLAYRDESGTGLSNQGWKDSGDSIQWADGRLAEGPIALCEVQGYAYEAALGAVALLDAFEGDGAGEEWLRWAVALRRRFTERFWIDGPAGGYPAIALDANGRKVDAQASNMGHLLGTGILDPVRAEAIARRLVGPALNSGYGLRTLSSECAGYWPLGYHNGSVWAHDTAIVIRGLRDEGFPAEAEELAEGLLAAAQAFDYRMPELHSGDSRAHHPRPAPYPAACRPQAWSAAAALVVADAVSPAAAAHWRLGWS